MYVKTNLQTSYANKNVYEDKLINRINVHVRYACGERFKDAQKITIFKNFNHRFSPNINAQTIGVNTVSIVSKIAQKNALAQ